MPLMKLLAGLVLAGLLGACASAPPLAPSDPEPVVETLPPEVLRMYSGLQDGDVWIEPVDPRYLSPEIVRQEVDYWTDERPGTIIVDPWDRNLYLVQSGDRAMRYSVGVGEAGRDFAGDATIPYGREWPRWTPTPNMLREDPETYEPIRNGVDGGAENPLGARALYLHRGGRDTLYRIHGTPYPWSIGDASSSGCIRMFQQDVIDLYERVDKGRARVTVLREDQAGQGTAPPGTALIATQNSQIPMAEAQTLQRMAEDDGLTLDMLLGGN